MAGGAQERRKGSEGGRHCDGYGYNKDQLRKEEKEMERGEEEKERR